MNEEVRIKIEEYLRKQLNNADIVASSYIHDENSNEIPGRNIVVKLRQYVNNFLAGDRNIRWIVITGLRGVGKTTAMMHIYASLPNNTNKLYLSVDRITELFGVSFFDVLTVYEDMLGGSFEQISQPLFLFIDEAQYDKKWAAVLKDVYDRAHNIFIFTTGSSALEFNMNVDSVRRPVFEKMLPLTFTEYWKLKTGTFEQKGLSTNIREAIFNSTNAKDVYLSFKKLEPTIRQYYAKIVPNEIKNYISKGSLPSLLFLPDDVQKFERITQSLKRVITDDIAQLYDFDAKTIRKIPMMLYNIAQAEQVSYGSFGNAPIEIDRHTAKNVIDALINTETLLRIPAYTASHSSQIRQPSKYIFLASAFRASFFQLTESISSTEDVMGKLVEDTVALYFYKHINKFARSFISYDAESGGADFIVGVESKKIVAEVGIGKKDYRQVAQTAKKVNANYSLVISKSELQYSEKYNAVKIPLDYFLLM